MMRIRSHVKKRLKKKFIIFTMLFITLLVLYLSVKSADNIANQIIVKEINIGANNEK